MANQVCDICKTKHTVVIVVRYTGEVFCVEHFNKKVKIIEKDTPDDTYEFIKSSYTQFKRR